MKTRHWFLLLIVIGVALRLGLLAVYQPASFPDTGTYIAAAQDLAQGGLAHSEGRRTPGYPLVMWFAGMRPAAIVALQAAGGIITSALLFYIALRLTGSAALAFAAGLAYDVSVQQLFLEGALLSESISTLTLAAVSAATIHVIARIRARRPVVVRLLLLGALSGAAILVRPQFVFLVALVPLACAVATGEPLLRNRRAIVNGASAIAPMLVAIVGWCGYVWSNTGFFALTTQTGMSLVNHSVAFVELAPDRYGVVRDILVKDRASVLKEKGHYGNTGWVAAPEMMRATGKTLPELSNELQRMSIGLFAAHPLRYAMSIARSWIDFWTVPIIWKPEAITPASLGAPLIGVWWIEHKLLRAANAAFVVLAIAVAMSRRMRDRMRWNLELSFVSALILLSSLVQAMADYGASSRYAVTIQALLLVVLAVACFNAAGGRRRVDAQGSESSDAGSQRRPLEGLLVSRAPKERMNAAS